MGVSAWLLTFHILLLTWNKWRLSWYTSNRFTETGLDQREQVTKKQCCQEDLLSGATFTGHHASKISASMVVAFELYYLYFSNPFQNSPRPKKTTY